MEIEIFTEIRMQMIRKEDFLELMHRIYRRAFEGVAATEGSTMINVCL